MSTGKPHGCRLSSSPSSAKPLFAPVSTAEDFRGRRHRGNQIVSEARSGASISAPRPARLLHRDGPHRQLDAGASARLAGPARGPVEETFFKEFLAEIETGLRAALPLDAVFVAAHGAALAEGTDDPDGDLFEVIRRVVGPDIPVVSTFDLHANVSRKMTDNLSVFVGYLENPHTDIYERGVEAAKHMRECLAARARQSPCQGAAGAAADLVVDRPGPYADLIKYGQTKVGGDILNVSVMAGFAYSDSPKNGLTAVVTARNGNRQAAADLSLDIARRAWGMKERFKRQMTAMADAVQLATSVGRDRRRKAIILADVADNPGGGGRGNTTYLLRALKAARAQHVLFGVFNDAAVAAKAHELGEGAIFTASFNSQNTRNSPFPSTARPRSRSSATASMSAGVAS